MSLAFDTFLFVVTFIVASHIIFLFFVKLSRENLNKVLILIISLGIEPALLSLTLYFLLLLFPGHSRFFYIFIVGIIHLILLTLCIRQFHTVKEVYLNIVKTIKGLKKKSGYFLLMVSVAIIFVLIIFIVGVNYPIVTHDALGYAMEGKLLYRDLSLEDFNSTKTDIQTGYSRKFRYSPGIPLIYTWFYVLKGSSDSDVLVRAVVPLYALYLLILLGYILWKRTDYSSILGIVLLVTIPAFITLSFQNSQDPIRIFFVVLSLVLLGSLLEKEKIFLIVLVSLATGLAMFVHGFGMLVLPIVLFMYFLFSKKKLKNRILPIVLIGFLSCCIGGWQYYVNFVKYGSIQGKRYNIKRPKDISKESKVEWEWWERKPRGQETIFKRYYFGYFQIFTNLKYFSIHFYLFLISIILWWKYFRHKTKLDKVFITAFLYFILMPIVLKLYDSDIDLWTNWRYIGTTIPIWAYFSGLVLSSGIDDKDKNPARRLWPVLLVVALVIPTESHLRENKIELKAVSTFFLPDKAKLQYYAKGYFKAVDYVNTRTERKSICLIFGGPRYYYYAERKGIQYNSREMIDFFAIENVETAGRHLKSLGINYIFLDDYYKKYSPYYYATIAKDIVEAKGLSQLVFKNEVVSIFKLNY